MGKTKKTALSESVPAETNLTCKYEKYTTILRSGLESRTSTRSSIVKEDIKKDDHFHVTKLIEQQKRDLLKNGLAISTIKVATYLLRDTIVSNWTDSSLVLISHILSSFLLILVTPLFVPRILRTYTIKSSFRLSVLGMTFIILTTYRPFPFVIIIQVFLCTFPESVLRVVLPLYMVRIAKIWSQISGIQLRTTILRVFALHNLLYRLRHILIATIKYVQADVEQILGNRTCGADYCERRSKLIGNYVYDVKSKNLDNSLIMSISFAILAASMAIGITVFLDRLDALSKTDFANQPKACKAIDVFLQLCRPRMSYLVGISLYHPFMTTMEQEYLEAYGTCSLARNHDYMLMIVVLLIGMHAILSAEIIVDVLGMIRSIQLALMTIIATFTLLWLYDRPETKNFISISYVFYILHYWTSIYGLFVALLTQQLIGDQEIAAWGIYTTIFYTGLTLSQAFRYTCMRTKLHTMIAFGLVVLSTTHFLRRQIERSFGTTVMKNTLVDEFQRRNKSWITDSSVNLDKAVNIAGKILWIETFWRRTVILVSRPVNSQDFDSRELSKETKKWCNLIERISSQSQE